MSLYKGVATSSVRVAATSKDSEPTAFPIQRVSSPRGKALLSSFALTLVHVALPFPARPYSSWRDIENKEQRFLGRQKVLDELFTAVRLCRPDDASEIPDSSSHRRNPKKKTTIKQLFSAASKFQVNISASRGAYVFTRSLKLLLLFSEHFDAEFTWHAFFTATIKYS